MESSLWISRVHLLDAKHTQVMDTRALLSSRLDRSLALAASASGVAASGGPSSSSLQGPPVVPGFAPASVASLLPLQRAALEHKRRRKRERINREKKQQQLALVSLETNDDHDDDDMDDSSDLEDAFFNDVHETLTTDDAHDLPITLTEQASEDEPKNRDAMDVDDVVTRTPATPKALAVTSTEQDDDDDEEEDGDTMHALAIVDDPWMCDARLVAWEDSIKDYYLKDEDKTDDDSFLLRTTSQPEQQQQLPQTISIATTATPTQTPTVSALLSSRATTPASSQQQPLKLKFTLSSMLSKEPAQPQQQKPVV